MYVCVSYLKEEGQVLKVLASTKSSACESCKGARKGDLLEIEYTGRLQDGKVFDGSSIKVSRFPRHNADATLRCLFF